MAKEYQLIDIELIWKSVNQEASEEESESLQRWLHEDARHRQYYEKANRFFRNGSTIDFIPSQLNSAWKKFEKAEGKTKRKLKLTVLVAASVVAALLLSRTLLYFMEKPRHSQFASSPESLISPGTDKAKLIFDDGRTYDLAKNANLLINERGTTIRNAKNQLEYITGEKSGNQLEYNILQVPRGGEFSLLLSDGTKVWLNSESLIRYPVSFPGDERKVELEGEAYFEVAKNKDKPFRVVSGNQVTEVLGTGFNITSYDEDPVVVTTLVEGHVKVSLKSNPQIAQLLNPNDQTLYTKAGKRISKRVVDPSLYIAWKYGRFVFKNELLTTIMNTLSRWYDVQVVFASERAKQIRFTGNLERYGNFEEVLEKIEKTNEVKFYVKGNQITIE